MATHPSILAWRIPWTEKPGKESDTTESTQHTHTPEKGTFSQVYPHTVYTQSDKWIPGSQEPLISIPDHPGHGNSECGPLKTIWNPNCLLFSSRRIQVQMLGRKCSKTFITVLIARYQTCGCWLCLSKWMGNLKTNQPTKESLTQIFFYIPESPEELLRWIS